MRKKRIIVPSMKRIRKWVSSALSIEDAGGDHVPDSTETTGVSIEIGDAYQKSRDPEHLPPTSAWQRFGNGVRGISRILRSQESAFGFRVACATLSIGIVAYLRDTQAFFVQQRLVWAMIMVAIGMTVTAGAGVFGFIGRIAGTSKASCCLIDSSRHSPCAWLTTCSNCHVHKLFDLVRRGRQDAGRYRAHFRLYILRILLRSEVSAFYRNSSHIDGHTSPDCWLRASGAESWIAGTLILGSTYLLDMLTLQCRSRRVADNLLTRSMNLHLTDSPAYQEACLSHSFGLSSHILSLPARSSGKI